MKHFLRLYTTLNQAETQEVLSDIDSGSAVKINWIPITEFITREEQIAVTARKLEFTCHLRFSVAERTGSMSLLGGPYQGEWKVIDAALLRNGPPTSHSFSELYRLTASNPHGRTVKVLVGIGLCREAPQPEITL